MALAVERAAARVRDLCAAADGAARDVSLGAAEARHCVHRRTQFCPWLAAHHIQAFYDALPYLESLLRVFPGFYSMWLRMWGSRVGYGVNGRCAWMCSIATLMDIGNRVCSTREVELVAHVRQKTEGAGSRVLVRAVRIGSHAFLGAGVRVGPGATCRTTPTCRR
jgi:acetyltransferase-like isoleucine patch superfamily enzyme